MSLVDGAANTGSACGDISTGGNAASVTILEPIVYTAVASCLDAASTATTASEYYVHITGTSGGSGTLTFTAAQTLGASTSFNGTNGTDPLILGPYPYADGDVSVSVADANSSNTNCSNCTATSMVAALDCNNPSDPDVCVCEGDLEMNLAVTPGTFNADASYTQVYLLVDNTGAGTTADGTIVAQSSDGAFDFGTLMYGGAMLEDGNYQVYALNYETASLASLPTFAVGDMISNLTAFSLGGSPETWGQTIPCWDMAGPADGTYNVNLSLIHI